MSLPERIYLLIGPDQAGRSLARIASDRLGPAADMLLARGGLWLNHRRVDDATQVAPLGAELVFCLPPGGHYAELSLSAADIVYEDECLLALNKQAGWYSNATPWDTQGNVLAAVYRWLSERDGGTPYVRLAHQLDRDTSGLLLIATSPLANPGLRRAFDNGTVTKQYLALVQGVPNEPEFVMQSGHGRSAGGRWRLYDLAEVGRELPGGGRVRSAQTRFVVARRCGDAAFVYAYPRTGRTHQIRLHLASAGHPLLGDTRYGGPAHHRGQELAGHLLHARSLTMPHPVCGHTLSIAAPLPAWANMV